jgi:hypothetical protein
MAIVTALARFLRSLPSLSTYSEDSLGLVGDVASFRVGRVARLCFIYIFHLSVDWYFRILFSV